MLAERFRTTRLPAHAEALRVDIRKFLDETLADYTPTQRAFSWMGFDAEFTKKLADRGWVGIAWPKAYGGQAMDAFCRYVLAEELLASGAPVLAHWTADRQSGPLFLRYGTESQRQRFLPAICRGESYFCIGMSEPDSGSDLAATRTRAVKTDGGWVLNGTKLWTTNAHRCHYMIALVRTSITEKKHEGLSQIVIDLSAKGVTIRPIRDLAGESHFNEVVFEDVFIPEDCLVGQEGNGWDQVMAELALERSGPERYLSSAALLSEMVQLAGDQVPGQIATALGRLMADTVVLRQMSLAIAGQLEIGEDPQLEAACVKDLGTELEQELPEVAHALFEECPRALGGSDYARVLGYVTQVAPSFSLRGGTREILRGIIARGLGVR